MKKSLAVLYTDSRIQLPLIVRTQVSNNSQEFQIRWQRNSSFKKHENNIKGIIPCFPVPLSQNSKSIYVCSPFDYGCIISAYIKQKTSGSKDDARHISDNTAKQIQFGPIQISPKIIQKVSYHNIPQIQIILNKNIYMNAQLILRPNCCTRDEQKQIAPLNLDISSQNSTFTAKFSKQQLEFIEQPFKLYQNQDNSFGVYIYHQYQQFMNFLRCLKTSCHYGKYLKICCTNKQDRDIILFNILSCLDPVLKSQVIKKCPRISCSNTDKPDTVPQTPSNNVLLPLNLKQIPQNQALVNTFGKNFQVYYENQSHSSNSLNQSPYFKVQQSKLELQKDSIKEKECFLHLTKLDEQQFKMNQVKSQKNINNPKSAQNVSHQLIESPHILNQLSPSLDQAFDNIFSKDDLDDDFYLSPSQHMVEDIYNILYTPYAGQKPRKQSFSSQNDFFNVDSHQHKQIFARNNSKAQIQAQKDKQYENNRKHFRQTTKENPYNYLSQLAESQQSKIKIHTMNVVPEETSGKTSNNDSELDQLYSDRKMPSTKQDRFTIPQNQIDVSVNMKKNKISTLQTHHYIKRQIFFRQKIEYLTKLNQQLMRENIHLKSIIKFERETKEKIDFIKMNEIKQMALQMVKRLQNAQKGIKTGEDNKIISDQQIKQILDNQYANKNYRNKNTNNLPPYPKNQKNYKIKGDIKIVQSIKNSKKVDNKEHVKSISPKATYNKKTRLSTQVRYSVDQPESFMKNAPQIKQNNRYTLGHSVQSHKTYSTDKNFGKNNKFNAQANRTMLHQSKNRNHDRSDILLSPSSHNSEKRRQSSLKKFLEKVNHVKKLKSKQQYKQKQQSPPKKNEPLPFFLRKRINHNTSINTGQLSPNFNENTVKFKNNFNIHYPQGNRQSAQFYRSYPTIPTNNRPIIPNSQLNQHSNKSNIIFNTYSSYAQHQ